MTSAELKLDIFRVIDTMKKNQLDELSGLISNYIHGQNSTEEWDKLSSNEKNALLSAKHSIRNGGGTEHSIVMKNIRQRVAKS